MSIPIYTVSIMSDFQLADQGYEDTVVKCMKWARENIHVWKQDGFKITFKIERTNGALTYLKGIIVDDKIEWDDIKYSEFEIPMVCPTWDVWGVKYVYRR